MVLRKKLECFLWPSLMFVGEALVLYSL